MVSLRGPKTEGDFAPELDTSKQRPAEYVFSRHVEDTREAIKSGKAKTVTDDMGDDEEKEKAGCCGCCCKK